MDGRTKVVIAIIVAAIIIWILLNIRVEPKLTGNEVSFESIKDQMKTGDVISMSTSYFLKKIVIGNYLGCDAIHTAMVVRVKKGRIETNGRLIEQLEVQSSRSTSSGTKSKPKGELYLLEIGPYGSWPFRRSDVRFTPLVDALKSCSHPVFGWTPIDREINFTDEDLKHYRDYRYNYFVPTMFSPYKKYKVCSTFVAKIHEDKGIGSDHHVRSPCDYYNDTRTVVFKL